MKKTYFLSQNTTCSLIDSYDTGGINGNGYCDIIGLFDRSAV